MDKRIRTRREALRWAFSAAAAPSLLALTQPGARAASFNKASAPSDLRITDVRGCTVAETAFGFTRPFLFPIIRIDTNQGVYGLGEAFTHGSVENVFAFKSLLLGANPLDLQGILRRMRRFVNSDGGTSGAFGFSSAFSAIDIALHDIAGKVYGVPVWRLLGGKMRDRVVVYCDTEGSEDPKIYGERMLERKKEGFRFFKMDLYTSLVKKRPGAVHQTGAATDKGLKYLCEYIAAVRDAIGWDAPLSADHFGDLSLKDCIRYARAFEPYQLAWAEDFLDYHDWQGYKTLSSATTTPLLTGEYAFGLQETFRPLVENGAVDVIHPDVTVCGGLLELRRIAEFADLYKMPVAIHACNSPVAQAASVHIAATLPNFRVLEYHHADSPGWKDLVRGAAPPVVGSDGHIRVSDAPGLGVELNEEAIKKNLFKPGYFEPTTMWDSGAMGGLGRRDL